MRLTCKYCGYKWRSLTYIKGRSQCPKCKDTRLKAEKDNTQDVYGYSNELKKDAYLEGLEDDEES